jgi:hypothetical protein
MKIIILALLICAATGCTKEPIPVTAPKAPDKNPPVFF